MKEKETKLILLPSAIWGKDKKAKHSIGNNRLMVIESSHLFLYIFVLCI